MCGRQWQRSGHTSAESREGAGKVRWCAGGWWGLGSVSELQPCEEASVMLGSSAVHSLQPLPLLPPPIPLLLPS